LGFKCLEELQAFHSKILGFKCLEEL
jgi:hypothetical protein